jgi:heat shock protein HslJ
VEPGEAAGRPAGVHRTALLLAAALTLAACAGGPGAGAPDIAGEWEFAEGTADGAALPRPPGARATLELGGVELRGVSFCNHYSSSYRLSGTSLSIGGIGGTEMGCEPDVMTAESAYLTALGAVHTAAVDDDGLVLTGDDVQLRFTPVAAVPDSPLEGTRWVLETLVEGETAASTLGEPAVLLLDPDLRASASTGCRSVTGTWLVEDGALVIDDLLADGECPADVERQDALVTAVLSAGPQAEIREDQLTLTGPDGRGLVYRAEG